MSITSLPNSKLVSDNHNRMIKEADLGEPLAAYQVAFNYLQGHSHFPVNYTQGEHYLKIVINNFDRTKLDDNQLIYIYILLASITSFTGRHGLAKKYFAKAYKLSHTYYHIEQADKLLDKYNFFTIINDSGYDLKEIISDNKKSSFSLA
jgi:hypothetical protein